MLIANGFTILVFQHLSSRAYHTNLFFLLPLASRVPSNWSLRLYVYMALFYNATTCTPLSDPSLCISFCVYCHALKPHIPAGVNLQLGPALKSWSLSFFLSASNSYKILRRVALLKTVYISLLVKNSCCWSRGDSWYNSLACMLWHFSPSVLYRASQCKGAD